MCHICQGSETIESAVRYQLIAEQTPARARPFIELCRNHAREAEGAYREVKRIQTEPVTINLPGLRVGGTPGRT